MRRQAMTMRWIEQREARQMLATVYPERSAAPVRRPAFRHCVRVESTVRWLERCAGWLMLPAGPLLLRPQPVLVRRYATPRRRIDD